MRDIGVGDLLVIRYSPIRAEKLIAKAMDEAKERSGLGLPAIYAISTYAVQRTSASQTLDDLLFAVCNESEPRGRNVYVTSASLLESEGFGVQRSEPPTHHHDVILGSTISVPDAERLESIFSAGKRKDPTWNA